MKVLRSLMAWIVEARIYLLASLCFALIILFAYKVKSAIGDGKFFLLYEDEVIYYCSGKVFAETGSVQAEGCIDENVSPIGKMNWYGPGYSLIYGTVFKVFGDAPPVFIWFNAFLGVAIVVLILLLKCSLEMRLLFIACILMAQQFGVYLFSYFPETLVLFLATALSVLLANHFLAGGTTRKYLVSFVILVFAFMLVRVTFVFWMSACLALATNRREFFKLLAFFFASVIIALLYMKYFTAPPYAASMHKIDYLFKGEIIRFVAETIGAAFRSLRELLTNRVSVINLLLGLVLSVAILSYMLRNRLMIAATLVSGCLLAVMFAYYNVTHFYFIKQTAMLLPLLLAAILLFAPISVRYALLLIMLIVFPSPLRKIDMAIEGGRNGYSAYESAVEFRNSLKEITHHIQPDATNILYCYNEFEYGNAAEALLPFSTIDHKPILYTTNIVDPNAEPAIKFVTHHRFPIHYILSKNSLVSDTLKEVHSTKFYHLYQVPSRQK